MSLYIKAKYINKLISEKLKYLYLFCLEFIPVDNFSISNYYGRLGNNLQQIANGIAYSEMNQVSFRSKLHPHISIITVGKPKYFYIKKYRFFNYQNKKKINEDTPKNSNLDYARIVPNIHRIFQEIIFPKTTFFKNINISADTLVIHIRSGDIFEKTKHFDQVQNPLKFYLEVIKNFKDILIVTSEARNNPVIKNLLSLDGHNVKIQSSSVEEDFNTLINATNLCLSGVGTFGIAAALLSPNLKNLFYSDLYMKSHLNPEMIDSRKVNKYKYTVSNYLEIGEWVNSIENIELMLDNNIEVKRISE
jgi:hypothetical protein